MTRRDTGDVLSKAAKVFDTAALGLADLGGNDPPRRLPGLHNVIVFGRATTFVLQNLRTIDQAAFDAWYEPYRAGMAADPLLRFFNKLRTELEKEGGASADLSVHIVHLDTDDLEAHKPPGATGFFIGDEHGGIGWHVVLPDGNSAKYYVQLPQSSVTATLTLENAPTEHLGKPIADRTALGLSRLYLAYIARVLGDAMERFGE